MFRAPALLPWTQWVLCNSPVSSVPLQPVFLHIGNRVIIEHTYPIEHNPLSCLQSSQTAIPTLRSNYNLSHDPWGHVRAVLWLPLPCQLCQAPSCSYILCQALLHLRAYALAFPSLGHFSSISYRGQFLLTAQGFTQAKHVVSWRRPSQTTHSSTPALSHTYFFFKALITVRHHLDHFVLTCSLSGSPL